MYQTSQQLGKVEQTMEYNLKSLELNKVHFGEKSLNVSNNYYIHS